MAEFRAPIEYLEKKQRVSQSLIDDLELEVSRSGRPSLYSAMMGESCRVAGRGRMEKRWARWFTSDRAYLEDTQALLSGPLGEAGAVHANEAPKDILEVWKEIEMHRSGEAEEAFHNQYLYVEWAPLRWANKNARLLWFLSLYNIGGPVLSLTAPIFMLMIPFCVLRIAGRPLTLQTYFELLKSVLAKHPIGQVFSFRGATAGQRMYIAFSVAFYGFQVYQNLITCARFWKNRRTIEAQLHAVREHLDRAVVDMDTLARAAAPLGTYGPFLEDLVERLGRLKSLRGQMDLASLGSGSWWRKGMAVGEQLRLFYRIYRDEQTRLDIDYSLDAIAYLGELRQVQALLQSGRMTACKWSGRKTTLRGVVLPGADAQVRNDCDLRTSILVTGPNASGKTTVLKATLFNLILSQQIGAGFYRRAAIRPFDHFHCYMNIPDTNDRDSLFQAEARRCRQILADITEQPKAHRHFCIFDELYSGTNPAEAIGGATAFLRHIARRRGVRFMMTTHFTELCRRLEKGKHVKNHHMSTRDNGESLEFSYKLTPGTTSIRGGIHVLRQLDYPPSIVEEAARETLGTAY